MGRFVTLPARSSSAGIDYTHPDLRANVWSAPTAFSVTLGGRTLTCPQGSHGFDAIRFSCNPLDDNAHGTHVAGWGKRMPAVCQSCQRPCQRPRGDAEIVQVGPADAAARDIGGPTVDVLLQSNAVIMLQIAAYDWFVRRKDGA